VEKNQLGHFPSGTGVWEIIENIVNNQTFFWAVIYPHGVIERIATKNSMLRPRFLSNPVESLIPCGLKRHPFLSWA
jgi:hypothetical protein